MAKKIDTSTWTDEEIKQGFAIRRRGGKSVIKISAEDGTVEHLGRTNESHPGKHKLSGTKMWVDDDYEERLKKYKEISKEANKRYKNGEIDKKERNKLIDDAHDRYIKGKSKNTEIDEPTTKELDVDKTIKTINEMTSKDELSAKARDTIIAGYDNYDDAVDEFARSNNIRKETAKQYFEEEGKKLGLRGQRITGEDDEIGYDPRKEAKYWLEKGEFDKFDKQLKDYGLEEERDEFLGGVNSGIERDYKEYSDKQKYLSIPEKERVQAYVDGKNWKDLVKEQEETLNKGKDAKQKLAKQQTTKVTKDTSIEDYKKWAKRKGYDDKDSSHIKEYLSITRRHKK